MSFRKQIRPIIRTPNRTIQASISISYSITFIWLTKPSTLTEFLRIRKSAVHLVVKAVLEVPKCAINVFSQNSSNHQNANQDYEGPRFGRSAACLCPAHSVPIQRQRLSELRSQPRVSRSPLLFVRCVRTRPVERGSGILGSRCWEIGQFHNRRWLVVRDRDRGRRDRARSISKKSAWTSRCALPSGEYRRDLQCLRRRCPWQQIGPTIQSLQQ